MKTGILSGVVLLSLVSSRAQDSSGLPVGIEADRPGYTTSPNVVGAGVLQLETGVSLGSLKQPGRRESELVLGSPLLRLGLGRRMELRLAGDGVQSRWSTAGGSRESLRGVSGFSLGAKIKLLEERALLPAVAVVSAVAVPSGSGAFSNSGYEPATTVAVSHGLPRGFSAGGAVDLVAVSAEGGRRLERAYSVSLGHPLPGGASGFCEVYRGPDGAEWVFDAGLSRAAGRNAQIDVAVGRDPRLRIPTWFAGVGLVLRGPSRLSWP